MLDTEYLDFVKKIPQYKQREPEWFEQRKGKLTSSDAATALGQNPYKKPVELLFEKCIGRPQYSNQSTLHGQKYEDEAIKFYEVLMGKTNHNFGLIGYEDLNPLRNYVDERYHFLGGSPDGIALDNKSLEKPIMIEVKCPFRRKIVHGRIPAHYYAQLQLNLAICNLDIADFMEYVPSTREFNLVRVYRCEKWFNEHFPILEQFWKDVQYWRNNDITKHPEYETYYGQQISMFIPEENECMFD